MNVMYQGQEFSVPEWAQFIAADDSGDVCVYEEHPKYHFGEKAYCVTRVRSAYVGRLNSPKVRDLQRINKEQA